MLQHHSQYLSIMIWENKSLPILSSFRKAIYCEQLLTDSRISKWLLCPHMPQLFTSICDAGATIGFLILSLIKSTFCVGGGHCVPKTLLFNMCSHTPKAECLMEHRRLC